MSDRSPRGRGRRGTRTLTITLFLVFVAVTLGITFWASRQTKTAADFYAGGRSFTGFQNGMAIGGDYMSAASFLGIAGIIALYGYDGFLYSIGFLVAWLVALLLVAELMRNSGKLHHGRRAGVPDAPAPGPHRRGRSPPIVVSIFYLLAQMVGAGALVALLLGIKPAHVPGMTRHGKIVTIVAGRRADDRLRDRRRHEGHHLGADRQGGPADGRRAADDPAGAGARSSFNLSALLGDGRRRSQRQGRRVPGARACGTASRSPDATRPAQQARPDLARPRAGARHRRPAAHPDPLLHGARPPRPPASRVLWAIGIIGIFYLMTLALGFGAAALVGGKAIIAAGPRRATRPRRSWPRRSAAVPRRRLGGAILLAFIAAVAFATILAVVAGLTLASSSSLAHDLYANVIKRGQTSPSGRRSRVARIAAFVIGAVAIVLAIFAAEPQRRLPGGAGVRGRRLGNLPAILYSLFWKRFNTRGATWAIYGGLVSALVLVIFSPVCRGNADRRMFPRRRLRTGSRWSNPGIISIPLGFLFGWHRHGAVQQGARRRPSTPSWRSARSPASAPRRRRSTSHIRLITVARPRDTVIGRTERSGRQHCCRPLPFVYPGAAVRLGEAQSRSTVSSSTIRPMIAYLAGLVALR